MTNAPVTKEPFIRIASRGKNQISLAKSIVVRLCAILAALIVCSVLIIAVTDLNPIEVYKAMFDGAFGGVSTRRLWETLRDTAILLCTSIAVTPAFRMRFWNIGAEGQILVGAAATTAVMMYLGGILPPWQLFTVMIITSIVAGLLWGFLPAFFKAFWNTNETLFTLMMNYVAIQLVSFLCIKWEQRSGSGIIGTINQSTKDGWIPTDFMSDVFGKFNYIIVVAAVLLITLFMFIYMKYSKHGYEIAVVGESENTARYAGINVKWVLIRTMFISGAIAGFTGFLLVAGSNSPTLYTGTSNGVGFTAIMVSWLAKFNPFGMIIISLFLTFMNKGAGQIASQFHLNESFSDIITGILLFFIIGCEFFLNYKIIFNFGKKNSVKEVK